MNVSDVEDDDITQYKNILQQTNAHKVQYHDDGRVKGNRGKKYMTIIKPLIGKGLKKTTNSQEIKRKPINSKMIQNPNVLVNRLRLLMRSQSTGHSAHEGEIRSILNHLKRLGMIKA